MDHAGPPHPGHRQAGAPAEAAPEGWPGAGALVDYHRPAVSSAELATAGGPAGVGDAAPSVDRYEALAPIAAEWDELADRLSAPPFLRPGWFEAWLRAYGDGRRVVLAARREGRLVGVLPLVLGRGAAAAPANWHTPVYAPLADGDDALRALASAALRERPSRLDLQLIDASDPCMPVLRAAVAERRLPSEERVVARMPFVDATGDFGAYAATLAKKHRKEVARQRRRLAEEGTVEFQVADGRERLEELLDEGFGVEGSGWKTENRSAIVSKPHVEFFYREVGRWAARRGWLRLAFLRLDGRPLAFDMCIEYGGATYVLKGGFDPEYRRFGPGSLLTWDSLERAFADPAIASYELLGTDDPYKLNWTETVRERVRLQAFRRSPLGLAQLAAWRHGRPLVRRVRAAIEERRRGE